MPAPRFITSESQIGAPGVYVLESAPPSPTRGQRNRIIALAGECVRGPVDKPVVCSTYGRFLDVFGARDHFVNGGTVYGHIWRALQGKRWGKLVICRAAADDADVATHTFKDGLVDVLQADASSPGIWGNGLTVAIEDATNGDADAFNAIVAYGGKTRKHQNLKINAAGDNNLSIVVGDDDSVWVTFTKLANGRPDNIVATALTTGSDGTIADTDFTAADRAMEKINAYAGVNAAAVVGRSNSNIKAKAETLAATTNQKVWYVCPDDEDVDYSAAVTERATNTGDRLSYWFNHCFLRDPITQEEMVEEPYLPVLSILSQTDPDIHPGDFDNAVLTRYIRRVAFELASDVRDALDEGGVSFMFHDSDSTGNEVILPGNALTCDNSVNNRDLDGRYMKDFVLDAVAKRLQGDQFKGNTKKNRDERCASVSAFLDNLARSERYIMMSEDGVPQYSYKNNQDVNTLDENAEGLQREVLIARLIPKNKQILLQAVIGVDATITEQ